MFDYGTDGSDRWWQINCDLMLVVTEGGGVWFIGDGIIPSIDLHPDDAGQLGQLLLDLAREREEQKRAQSLIKEIEESGK